MLIGIPALLGPELLAAPRAMGNGDDIAHIDPAEQANRLIRADGRHLVRMPDAVLRILPVGDAGPEALFRASGQC
jgi:L-fucose mutarotase